MNSHDEIVKVKGRKATPEDESWLSFGVTLREQAASAYNEAAKILVTASSLFLAFYGSMAVYLPSKSVPVVIMLIPAVLILVGVSACVAIIVPFRARILTSDITEIREYAQNNLDRKHRSLLFAVVFLCIGVVLALLFLFLS